MWLDRLGTALPLRHFAHAMTETFDPAGGTGSGRATCWCWRPGACSARSWPSGVSAGCRAARRRPRRPRPLRRRRRPRPAGPAPRPIGAGRRTPAALLAGQVRYALISQWRDPLSVFFAVVFPVLLLALFPAVFGAAPVHGLAPAQYLLPGLTAYAIAVAGYVTLPEAVAQARGKGVLKRLRGTPLPLRWYVAGRVGRGAGGVDPVHRPALWSRRAVPRRPPRRGPAAGRRPRRRARGRVLRRARPGGRRLLRSATSLVAITLGTLLPLSFVSDVFPVGDAPLPGWPALIGNLFPLKHLAALLLAATSPAGPDSGIAAGHLAVVAAWTVAALLILRVRGLFRG
ncbi:hypothetical protein GCM10020358_29840 [Amorphoplanes nipponensis]|uniref:ABC transporter permease n=1 Tax=Actinoplanes nipponensis TaxID=135950 RepID=UPI0031EC56E8